MILCGAAMKFAGCSRPASGIEHYFSHIWDMRGCTFGTAAELHGIQCAIGTLEAVKLYEKVKKITPNRQKAINYVKSFDFSQWSEELRAFLGKSAEAMIALEEKEQKYSLDRHAKRIALIIEKWDEILQVVEQELPTLPQLEALFDKVGLPKRMEEIGIAGALLPMTFKSAKDIRDKYVLPSLCWDLGILDEIV